MLANFELTEKQAEYIRNAHHRWNVACGAVRSGKSYCQVSYCIPARLTELSDKRGLNVILGATRDNIERNILQPMRDIYGQSIATEINSKNISKIMGEKVYCFGADNIGQVRKIRGSEIKYCAIDEGIDINEEVFNMLKSRLSLPWSICDITTNPAGPNHPFKKFLDSKKNGVDIYEMDYSIYDNPFLPPEYIHALELEYAGTMLFDRYILGRWTQAEGLIYPNFHKCLTEDRFTDISKDRAISLDYGTSNPFAGLFWEKRGKAWIATHEIYYSGRDEGMQKTDDEYLQMLEDFIGDLGLKTPFDIKNAWGVKVEYVDRIPVIIDPSAASFIALLRKSKYFRPIPANNSVLSGIRETNTAMYRGLILISTECKNFIEEAQSYVWDKNAVEDTPVKMYDHLMDAMRYFVKTMRIVTALDNYKSVLEG